MVNHTAVKGDTIISNITHRIWIDEGEKFEVLGIIKSEYSDAEGVLFLDRTGTKRVFWNPAHYKVVPKYTNRTGINVLLNRK